MRGFGNCARWWQTPRVLRWLTPLDHRWPPGRVRLSRWYWHSLHRTVGDFAASGARVVMTTGAYAQVLGTTEALKSDTDCRNALAYDFAVAHPTVALVDLGRYVCPARDRCRTTVDGITLREDGAHYRGESARLIARWLLRRFGGAFDRPNPYAQQP